MCVSGIRHFRYMLEGRPFTIYTDHKPLTFALGMVSEPWTATGGPAVAAVAASPVSLNYTRIAVDVPGDSEGGQLHVIAAT